MNGEQREFRQLLVLRSPYSSISSVAALALTLRSHLDSSTKSYHCSHPSCTKSFARSDLLLRHKRLHERPGGLVGAGNGGPGPAIAPAGAGNGAGGTEDMAVNGEQRASNEETGNALQLPSLSLPPSSSAPPPPPTSGFILPPIISSLAPPSTATPANLSSAPTPAFPSPSTIASTHLSLPSPLPSSSAALSAPTPSPTPQYPPAIQNNEAFNQFVHQSGLWSMPSLSSTSAGEGFAPHPHALSGSGAGGGSGNLLGGAGSFQSSPSPFADLTNSNSNSGAEFGGLFGGGGLGFGGGLGNSFGGSGAFGTGGGGFGFEASDDFGGGAGLGGGMAPGWDSWDMSLAWLVEGAVSRVGSPVAGAVGGYSR